MIKLIFANQEVLRYVYVPFQSKNTEKQEKVIEPMFFQFHSESNGPLRLKEGFYINLIREYFEKVSCTLFILMKITKNMTFLFNEQ